MTRNKELHGATMEEQNKIQRIQAIRVMQQKYGDGLRNVKYRFPSLYRETYLQLSDMSTFHILKWIETYELIWRTLNRENTKERRRLIRVAKKAYINKSIIHIYDRLTLFTDTMSTLIRRSTSYLTTWKSNHVVIL